MCDDPYYYEDGKAFALSECNAEDYDFGDSRNGPKKGVTIHAGGKKIKLLKVLPVRVAHFRPCHGFGRLSLGQQNEHLAV